VFAINAELFGDGGILVVQWIIEGSDFQPYRGFPGDHNRDHRNASDFHMLPIPFEKLRKIAGLVVVVDAVAVSVNPDRQIAKSGNRGVVFLV